MMMIVLLLNFGDKENYILVPDLLFGIFIYHNICFGFVMFLSFSLKISCSMHNKVKNIAVVCNGF